MSLRWIAIMSAKVDCDLAASTGVHDGEAVIKQILAGADAVQVVSCLYQNGPAHIKSMIGDIKEWLASQAFKKLSRYKGQMSQAKGQDPSIYERAQFMRYFGGKKNIIL
jgi:dihydroorotate dehydrogenase (fumarate)